jgi:hypothetical protein
MRCGDSYHTKPELTAKASMAQPVSQPAVYANGLRYIHAKLEELSSEVNFHNERDLTVKTF